MEMTNREALRAAVDNINSNGGVPPEQWTTLLLTSIADSLAIIADTLTDRKDNSNANDN